MIESDGVHVLTSTICFTQGTTPSPHGVIVSVASAVDEIKPSKYQLETTVAISRARSSSPTLYHNIALVVCGSLQEACIHSLILYHASLTFFFSCSEYAEAIDTPCCNCKAAADSGMSGQFYTVPQSRGCFVSHSSRPVSHGSHRNPCAY